MKRWIKAISLILAISVLAGVFTACGGDSEPKKEGDILAIYNGIPVYESEVQDIINYHLMTRVNQYTSEQEMMYIMGEAIGVFVQYKVLELDFNERNIKIDEKVLEERVAAEKKALDEGYQGGYENWKKIYRLSDNFIKEDVRRRMLSEIYYAEVIDTITVTDEEAKAYMRLHANDYYNPAGFAWTIIFREVKDITDSAECQAAQQEAQEFIDRIMAGDTTLEEAKVDLLEKYTKEDGYTKALLYNGENFTSRQDILVEIKTPEQLRLTLEEIDDYYSKRDPNADVKSEEYENYMNWIAETYEAELYFALQNVGIGEIYEKPLRTFAGYGILRLDSVAETSYFDDYEEVKDELLALVLEEKFQTMFHDHLEALHHKYNVEYTYTAQSMAGGQETQATQQ